MSAAPLTASDSIATSAREPLPTESAVSQSTTSLSSGNESPLPSRRDFLKVGSVLAGALVLPQAATIRAALAADSAANSLPLIGAGVVQLFVDYDRVDAVQNVRRICHSVEKHPENPVIRVSVRPGHIPLPRVSEVGGWRVRSGGACSVRLLCGGILRADS